jgi:hypothetical protein
VVVDMAPRLAANAVNFGPQKVAAWPIADN